MLTPSNGFFGYQDSYALCRVFKKNGLCSEVEELGQSSSIPLLEYYTQGVSNEHETMSPDFPLASSSTICMEEEEKEDKDESWMQFITDDVWCSSSTGFGGEEMSHMGFTN